MNKLLKGISIAFCSALGLGAVVSIANNSPLEAKADYTGDSPYVITLDDNSLSSSTSYVSTPTSVTINGVNLTFYKYNPSSGQVKSGEAYIYNTSPMPSNITKIEFYYTNLGGANNDWRVGTLAKVGSSAFTSSNCRTGGATTENQDTTNKKLTWDFTGENTYFSVYAGSLNGNCYASLIKVYFDESKTVSNVDFSLNDTSKVWRVNDTVTPTDIKAVVHYSNNTERTVTDGSGITITSGDLLTIKGSNTVYVNYEDAFGEDDGEVIILAQPEKTLIGVDIIGDLDNKTFFNGEDWDLSGLMVTATYAVFDDDPPYNLEENIGTLSYLMSNDRITCTLDPAKPTIGIDELLISDVVLDGTQPVSEFFIDGITTLAAPSFRLYENSELIEGDYIITGVSNNTTYSMSNVKSNNNKRLQNGATPVIEGNVFTNPDDSIIWHIAKDGDDYTFYSDESHEYAACNGGNQSTTVETVDSKAKWSYTYENGKYKFTNGYYSGYLASNTTNGWGVYGNSSQVGNELTLYKKMTPAIELSVENDATTLGTGGHTTLTATLINGATGTIEFVNENDSVINVTDNGDGTANVSAADVGSSTVTVSCPGCNNQIVTFTVVDHALVDSVEIKTLPTKLSYNVGDTLDTTGLVLTVHYSDGSGNDITTGFTVDSVDMSTKGEREVKISYTEEAVTRAVTYNILLSYRLLTVTEAIAEIEAHPTGTSRFRIQGVVVSKGNFSSGYAMDYTIAETYNEKDTSKQLKLYNFNNQEAYNNTRVNSSITVESEMKKYNSTYETFNIGGTFEVIEYQTNPDSVVTSVKVTTKPTKLTYFLERDTALDLTGLVVTGRDNYGVDATLDSTEYTVDDSAINWQTKGKYDVTVTHTASGFSDTFEISLVEVAVDSIEIVTEPTKLSYAAGEAFDKTGLSIRAHYNTGEELLVVDINEIEIDTQEHDGLVHSGDTFVTVKYGDASIALDITVSAATLTKIEIQDVPNCVDGKDVVPGDTFRKKGLVVWERYSDPLLDKKINIDNLTLTLEDGYVFKDSDVGTKEVTVSYLYDNQTYTAKFSFTVLGVTSIELTSNVRINYTVGDALEHKYTLIAHMSNGQDKTLTYHYENDPDKYYEDYTVDTVNMSTEGVKTVTIRYSTVFTTYQIRVHLTESALNTIKANAIAELHGYCLEENYDSENWATITNYVNGLDDDINECEFSYEVADIVAAAKAYLDTIPTKSGDSLYTQKQAAKQEIQNYYDAIDKTLYDATGLAELASILQEYKDKIDAANNLTAIEQWVATAKNRMDEVAKANQNPDPVNPDTPDPVNPDNPDTPDTPDTPDPVNPEPEEPSEEKTLDRITVSPTIYEYVVGDEIDKNSLVVTAHYSDGSSETVTDYEITFDSSVANENAKVTITYQGKTVSYYVTVKESVKPAALSGGAIAGIAVGGTVVAGTSALAVYLFVFKKLTFSAVKAAIKGFIKSLFKKGKE